MSESNGSNLLDVHKLINGARNEEHGEFADNVTRLARYMYLLTGKQYSREEARCFFIALKLCRVHNGQLGNDTLNDLVGYLALINDDIEKHGQNSITDRDQELDKDGPIPRRPFSHQDWTNGKRHLGGSSWHGPDASPPHIRGN